ncbi:MAG: GNAT family protein [Polyangiaceae bacterium]
MRPLRLSDHEAWRTANLTHPPSESIHDPGPRPAGALGRMAFRGLLDRNSRLQRADLFYAFALFDRAEKTMFGLVSLQILARIMVQSAWIGWRIYGQHRRRGYAREGVLAVFEIAFRELSLHRLEAGIEPDNRISARLARTVGMRKEASQKRSIHQRGDWVDLDIYSIHSEDCGIHGPPTFALSLGDRRRVEPRK